MMAGKRGIKLQDTSLFYPGGIITGLVAPLERLDECLG